MNIKDFIDLPENIFLEKIGFVKCPATNLLVNFKGEAKKSIIYGSNSVDYSNYLEVLYTLKSSFYKDFYSNTYDNPVIAIKDLVTSPFAIKGCKNGKCFGTKINIKNNKFNSSSLLIDNEGCNFKDFNINYIVSKMDNSLIKINTNIEFENITEFWDYLDNFVEFK